MTTLYEIDRKYKKQWARQILAQRSWQAVNARKGIVAMYLHDRSKACFPYVEVGSLEASLLYEDDDRSFAISASESCPLRFCGYRATINSHGLQFGGPMNAIYYKNLMIMPNYSACGQRLQLADTFYIELALGLDRCLTAASQDPALCRPTIELPPLWAGFRQRVATSIRADGPEFRLACRQKGATADQLLQNTAREFQGLKLYPLEWTVNSIESASAVFAEMTNFRHPFAFRIERLPEDLIGYSNAMAFDFYHNRFRRLPAA